MSPVVVFDMDDTLFPEESFVRSALAEVGRHAEAAWGATGFAASLVRLFDGGRRGDLFQEAWLGLMAEPLAPERTAELLLAYRAHRPASLPWFPDAAAIMDEIASRHTLGLISDGYLPTQANKFEALGASRWIKDPIFTEAIGREFWKPSPRSFELMMSRHPRAQFAYVADNPSKDFVAPNALGWMTVQVARPDGIHVAAPVAVGGSPLFRLESLLGLPELLQSRHP